MWQRKRLGWSVEFKLVSEGAEVVESRLEKPAPARRRLAVERFFFGEFLRTNFLRTNLKTPNFGSEEFFSFK